MTATDTTTSVLPNAEAPTPEYLHEAIRRECNDAQNGISARIRWLIGIQGFLFTAYSVAAGHDPAVAIWWFTHLALPALGIAMALLGLVAIGNAMATLKAWLAQERAFHGAHPGYALLRIEADRHQHSHLRGMRFARRVPVVFAAAWLLVLGHGLLELRGADARSRQRQRNGSNPEKASLNDGWTQSTASLDDRCTP